MNGDIRAPIPGSLEMLNTIMIFLEHAEAKGDLADQEKLLDEIRHWRFRYSGNQHTHGSFTYDDYVADSLATDEGGKELTRRRRQVIESNRRQIYTAATFALEAGSKLRARAYATAYASGNEPRADAMLAELLSVELLRANLARRRHVRAGEILDPELAKHVGVDDLDDLLPSWLETPGDPLAWTAPPPRRRFRPSRDAVRPPRCRPNRSRCR